MLPSVLLALLIAAGTLNQPPESYRLELQALPDGAELITVFGHLQGPDPNHTAKNAALGGLQNADVPLLSVLRDSLGDGDPANDRLRYVWILTSTKPTVWQRAASALSFGYFRAGSRLHAKRVPTPTLDLAAPYRGVFSNLASDSLQAMELDPLGAAIRSTTRTYRGNSSDYGKLQVFEALATLDNLDRDAASVSILPDSQFREIYARLSLSTHAFGGLVRRQELSHYYDKQSSRLQEMRGHNWELLRQRAELNGLIFDPLALPSATPSQAMLWIARSHLDARAPHPFDGKFLGIANPWTDERLRHWTGYTQVRYFDADHQPVPRGTPGARSEEMIPLALYSLDYPRVPLLLADFRDAMKPKRREMVDEGASSLVTGVFGLTGFANPEFFFAAAAWNFVRGRTGGAVNRSARLEAYSEAREFLSVDTALDPALKIELQRRLDHLALNPRENEVSRESELAREQYAALLNWTESPRGEAKLARDRRKELEADTEPAGRRFWLGFGRVFTRGPHVDPEEPDLELRAQLDAYRRSAYHMQFLDQVLASSPSPDVVWDPAAIGRSISALAPEAASEPKAEHLITQVCARSTDNGLRATCARALQDRETAPALAAAGTSEAAAGTSVAAARPSDVAPLAAAQ